MIDYREKALQAVKTDREKVQQHRKNALSALMEEVFGKDVVYTIEETSVGMLYACLEGIEEVRFCRMYMPAAAADKLVAYYGDARRMVYKDTAWSILGEILESMNKHANS